MTRDVPDSELRQAMREGRRLYYVEQQRLFDAALANPDEQLPEGNFGPDPWWLWRRELPDGRVLYLRPMGYGQLYLSVSPNAKAQTFDDTWAFDDHDAGWRAALGWDGSDEPLGWVRHPRTRRIRIRCPRCGGTGELPGYLSHVKQVQCAECGMTFERSDNL